MIDTAGTQAEQGKRDHSREIIRMDMVGVDVVLLTQGRRSLLQTLDREAVVCINPRHTKNAKTSLRPPCPGTQHLFRIDAPPGAQVTGSNRPCFIKHGTAAVAIHPGGADINEGRALG